MQTMPETDLARVIERAFRIALEVDGKRLVSFAPPDPEAKRNG